MGFAGSLFGGSNSTLSSDINKFGQIGDFATGMGEKNLTTSSNFWNSILSGDSSKQSQALAPQIGAAKQSAQQQNKTTAEMGTRSGGNAASNAGRSDKTRSDITGMIGQLTGNAASNLGSSGSSLLSQGASAYGQQVNASQQQMSNWQNSILGKFTTRATVGM